MRRSQGLSGSRTPHAAQAVAQRHQTGSSSSSRRPCLLRAPTSMPSMTFLCARSAPFIRQEEDDRVREREVLHRLPARLLRRVQFLLALLPPGKDRPIPVRRVDRPEVKELVRRDDFRGTITDIGGPTANLYEAHCELWKKGSTAMTSIAWLPRAAPPCASAMRRAWSSTRRILAIPGVRHLFVGSGMRYDLLLGPEARTYFRAVCERHVSGYLKVAPEHSAAHVLQLMGKPGFGVYESFAREFKKLSAAAGKEQ